MKPAVKTSLMLALLLDALLDEPPNRWHPVAWMGGLLGWAERAAPQVDPLPGLAYGAGLVLAGNCLVIRLVNKVEGILSHLPVPLALVLQAGLLKLTLAPRGLNQAAAQAESALANDDLPRARRLVSWHLVSRDTSTLTASGVAAATIESVAENLSDGVVAPMFYYWLGGLPLAFAYRFTNTADSILGYHDARHEWLGKVAARLDDVANWLPARLSAALIGMAAWLGGENGTGAWQIVQRDARLTQSPNAGYPMSAMAGALGVQLEKVRHYRLGEGLRAPDAADIRTARRLLSLATLLGVALFCLLPGMRGSRASQGKGSQAR
jgi:adenosylcobinamide-phosphate synthase